MAIFFTVSLDVNQVLTFMFQAVANVILVEDKTENFLLPKDCLVLGHYTNTLCKAWLLINDLLVLRIVHRHKVHSCFLIKQESIRIDLVRFHLCERVLYAVEKTNYLVYFRHKVLHCTVEAFVVPFVFVYNTDEVIPENVIVI